MSLEIWDETAVVSLEIWMRWDHSFCLPPCSADSYINLCACVAFSLCLFLQLHFFFVMIILCQQTWAMVHIVWSSWCSCLQMGQTCCWWQMLFTAVVVTRIFLTLKVLSPLCVCTFIFLWCLVGGCTTVLCVFVNFELLCILQKWSFDLFLQIMRSYPCHTVCIEGSCW